ncbi:MAG: hypothetical protein ABUT39_14035 [Acidobacteriota bacterium]
MRSSLKKTVVLGLFALGMTAVAASAASAASAEGRAARREEARTRILASLEERMVRPVEKGVLEREARSIERSLSDEQIDAVLDGDEPGKVQASTEDGSLRNTTAAAVGDPDSDLLFVPVDPCRIIDTRSSTAGKMQPNVVRDFKVVGTTGFEDQGGNPGGCGIPAGGTEPLAAAVMVNIVAVDAEGGGNMRAWEFNQTMPNASSINYQQLSPNKMNIANGLIVPIAGVSTLASDLSVMAAQNRVHLVADVSGYFTRFPVEQFQSGLKSTVLTHDVTTLTDLSDGACKELNTCTITADTDGTVIVEAWGQFVANHAAGTLDRVAIGVETAASVVCNDSQTVDASDFEVPASLGTNVDVDFTVSHGRSYSQNGGTTQTYRLSGQMLSGANSGDSIENSRLICTFIPD